MTTSIAPKNTQSLFNQVVTVVRWPFTSRFASPLWLALRLYLAYLWFQYGWGKIEAGWLTSDPVGHLFGIIVSGKLAVPLPFFRDFAAFMLNSGGTVILSRTIPFCELAVSLAFLTGVLVVPASIGGILLVTNVIMSGIGTLMFDGRVILLHVLLILAWRVVGLIGFEALIVRVLRGVRGALRPTPALGAATVPARRQ